MGGVIRKAQDAVAKTASKADAPAKPAKAARKSAKPLAVPEKGR